MRARPGTAADPDATGGQLIGGTDHRRPVPGVHPQIPARTCHQQARFGGFLAANHRHRRQVAVDLAQRRPVRCLGAGDDELDSGRLQQVRGVRQACLDDRGRRKVGDVEDGARPVVRGHRPAQHVIGQPRDHPHARIGFPCQQGDFEIDRVVVADTDDGKRAVDLGVGELGGGRDLDDARAGVVKLRDDRRCQRVVTADDDVLVHVLERIAAEVICHGAARAIP